MLSGRRKLLLADDSPTIQKVINLTFEDEEMEVVAVSNGDEALRILEEQSPPDILLADVLMPGPNGYELCEWVKRDARLRHIPVILLVGAFEPYNEAEARRVGADTVLTKPFQSIRDLVSKVGSLLGGGGSEPEREDEMPAQQARAEESADEAMTLQADVPMRHTEGSAPAVSAFGMPGASFGRDAADAPAFADLSADDELIQATPAESFRVAGDALEASREEAPAVAEEPEKEPQAVPEPLGAPAEEPYAPRQTQTLNESVIEARSHEPAGSAMVASLAFAARAASSTVTADDVLLDLGQMQSPAAYDISEDDFVLDLGLDEPAPPAPQTDAPSAFAEASHGGSVATFDEYDSPLEGFEHSATSVSIQEQDVPVAEIVMQDEPQAFGAHEVSVESHGFIEPSVVPADAPVPAMIVDEYSDGSVEGDVAKAPVSPYTTQPVEEPASEPSTAGYVVGEARAVHEEGARADHLSPEAIDKIARRVVEQMSESIVREIAWEVVPDLAELLIKRKLDEEKKS